MKDWQGTFYSYVVLKVLKNNEKPLSNGELESAVDSISKERLERLFISSTLNKLIGHHLINKNRRSKMEGDVEKSEVVYSLSEDNADKIENFIEKYDNTSEAYAGLYSGETAVNSLEPKKHGCGCG